MKMVKPSAVFLLFVALLSVVRARTLYWDYIVVGAGPSGLQMGHFLQRANRNYIIVERANVSGSFFIQYPRHDKLISINKRYTGKSNKEFNLRHDWNSLLSDDESLYFKHYSKKFFPHKDTYVKYLYDYETKLGLKVKYDTSVGNIRKELNESTGASMFVMDDQKGNTYTCRTIVIATGMGKPNEPQFDGFEHSTSYQEMSMDPEDYEGKSVLILGRGNTAFEVADGIYGSTNVVHMLGRSRVRLSWATHYVGDLRAVNNGLLDTYQLKSLDGVLEAPVEDLVLTKKNGKIILGVKDGMNSIDNFAMRDTYDAVIRCLGFKFDMDIFSNQTLPSSGVGRRKKFPMIKHNYESSTTPGMFFAGGATHSLDFRKSAGGFIHGYRYTARALHQLLEWRNHQVKWASIRVGMTDLLSHIIKRINEASGTYQMFQMLGDVIAIRNNGQEFEYIEEFPIHLIHDFTNYSGHEVDEVIVVVQQYGANFSAPGNDIFRLDRATGEPSQAHTSNFLHPVFYYYKELPTELDMQKKNKWEVLPRPHRLHHLVEDFLTDWTAPISHVLPLRRFLDNILDTDTRHYFAESCLRMMLTHQNPPISCQLHFMQGQGVLSPSGVPLGESESVTI